MFEKTDRSPTLRATGSLLLESLLGVAVIVAATLPISLARQGTLAAPFPVWFLLVPFEHLGIYTLPSVVFVATLSSLGRRRIFGSLVLGSVAVVALLNAGWLWSAWGYGVEYQSLSYTISITLLNASIFSVILLIASLGHLRRSWRFQYIALVLLFAAVVWCAFPYLGEPV